MKIRLGFVSNSSSSSFCVFGTALSSDAYDNLTDEQIKILSEANIDSHGSSDYDSGETMVGRSLTTIKDDETGLEFKTKVKEAMEKVFGDDISKSLSICEDAWYNG